MTGDMLHQTTSLCRVCKEAVPARVVAREPGVAGGPERSVWMEKSCPVHGPQEVQLSDDAGWYERTRTVQPHRAPPRRTLRPVALGCPFDCGACQQHLQKARTPVISITSACNLDCPKCFVHNKNQDAFHISLDEYRQILARISEESQGDVDLVNITGGDPTMHPQLLEILELTRAAGVHRISLCTNGIRLAQDEGLVAQMAALGTRIALSFDSFEEGPDYALQGAHLVDLKLRCLDLLEKHDVDTTLIPVMTRGANDQEIGRILRRAMSKPHIRHVEVHTMTFTGPAGVSFDRSGRISLHEVLLRIASTTDGWLLPEDFIPSPCAHPLCYQVAYLLMDPDGGQPVPFTRFLDRQTLYDCLGEHLYLEPSPGVERAITRAIDRLWAEDRPEDERTLNLLKRMLRDMFPTDRTLGIEEAIRIAERCAKAVYVHSHMDEETFDVERVAHCCDSNCYPDGTTIPVCAYNVLYRDKESRFMAQPRSWGARAGGVR